MTAPKWRPLQTGSQARLSVRQYEWEHKNTCAHTVMRCHFVRFFLPMRKLLGVMLFVFLLADLHKLTNTSMFLCPPSCLHFQNVKVMLSWQERFHVASALAPAPLRSLSSSTSATWCIRVYSGKCQRSLSAQASRRSMPFGFHLLTLITIELHDTPLYQTSNAD